MPPPGTAATWPWVSLPTKAAPGGHPFLFEQFDPFVARTETQRVVTEVWDEVDLGDRVPYRQKRTVVETVTKV